MGESRVKSENYITIQGFMVKDFNLKGNELLIYAIIYGFSQAEGQVFSGSLQYLADWTNSTKQGVTKNLKSLVEKKLIEKKDIYVNGVKFCEYCTTEFNGVYNKVDEGIQQSLIPPMQQSLTNNIVIDNIEDNIKNNKEKTYFENDNLNSIFIEFLEVRKKLKAVNSDRAINTLINTLNGYDDETKYKMIENSIVNSWKSVYPLKENKPNASNNYKRVEEVPEWLNKDIKKETASDEEIKELENAFKEFKPNPELQERLRTKYGKGANMH